MEKHNFLITGFGRSGTMFLSSVMNQSKKWTVLHEPRGADDETRIFPTPTSIEDWNKDYYGEVNSRMRFHFYDVDVAMRGIILRDPEDIILSIANRKPEKRAIELIKELYDWYQQFYYWIDKDESIIPISFYKMTTKKDYLDWLLRTFSINDVDISKIDLTKKVNENRQITYTSFYDLPISILEEYRKYGW